MYPVLCAASKAARANYFLRYAPTTISFGPSIFHRSVCQPPKKSPDGGTSSTGGSSIKRREHSAPVVFGFIPKEWFEFFHVKTGVSGGYIFLLVLTNYCVSKEIYVMEHEYYLGLSVFVLVYYITTRLGKDIGKSLDKEVDAVLEDWNKGRKSDIAFHENIIKQSKDAVWRAEGQQILMEAKKENVILQLEAAYRERLMHVYRMVKGRMDYHSRRYYTEARIQQKWMIGWILREVMRSITPEFEQAALKQAIADLEQAASKA